ncbi:MAG: ankyrin repeat domain-containing protein [Legionella sp.]|uniref:ankyrin repeat domain-containing protein n=1 Tax=Legionella sp. TaxID=459 RepID=UPI00284EC5CE|nr:ankyrin repeat domain-containing protein [Legionella sp.]
MLPILYHDIHTSQEELMVHQDLILAIASGEKTQIKQLVNMTYLGKPVYRAKINDKYRLVYTYEEHEEKKMLMILTVMEDHDYNKLRRLLAHSQGGHEAFLELEIEQETTPVLNPQQEQLNWQPAVSYMTKILLLDESQQMARKVPAPVIFMGAPGSGKTSLIYTQMLRYLNVEMEREHSSSSSSSKVLFLSPSPGLVDKHEKQYKQEMPYAPDAVIFRTWENLLQNAYPYCSLVKGAEFADWLKKQGCTYPSKNVHYEFSLMTALGTPKYLTLGKRQCHYSGDKTKQGQLLRLWNSWDNYLKQNHRIDPMVSLLPPNAEHYASIYLDEAQNLPPVALRSLIPLALNHHVVSALDSDQCLFSSPYIQNCFETLLHIHCGNYSEEILTQDWRSPPEITALGNRINETKHKMDADRKKRAYKNVQSALTTKGRISWINAQSFQEVGDSYGALAGTAVIVFTSDEEVIAEVQKKLKCINVLTPAQAIGLDYDTVILWNPFTHAPAITQLDPTIKQEYSIEQWNALNTLYVAIKRAQQRLFIYEEQKRWMQSDIVELLLGVHPMNELHTSELKPTTPEQEELKWLAQEKYHREEGNIKQAAAIRVHHLPSSPVLPLPVERPSPERRTVKQPKKATSSSTLDRDKESVKKLLQRIQGKDWSAIKLLIQHDKAEYYLYDVPPEQMNLSKEHPNVLSWLMFKNNEQCCEVIKILKRMLIDLSVKKNTKAEAFLNLLTRVYNVEHSIPVLELVLAGIIQDPPKSYSSLLSFLQKKIHPELLARCVNPPDILPSFWKSAQIGDWNAVKRWKQLGADLSRCDQNGNTLMALAAMNPQSSIQLFNFLKDSGIDPNYWSRRSNLPAIHLAALKGFVPILKALKEVGANLNLLGAGTEVTPRGVRPIYLAIREGNLDAVRFLVAHDACLPTVFDSELFRTTFVPQQSMWSNKSKRIHDELEKKIQESYQSERILLFPHEQAIFSGHPGIEALLLRSSSYQKLRATSQIGFFGSTKPGSDAVDVSNEDETQLSYLPAPQ